MFKNRCTAEEAAELLTADNDPDGNDLESSSEDDLSSIGGDENQPILSNSDSDDTEASLTSSESESEYDDELKHFDISRLFLGYQDIIIVTFIWWDLLYLFVLDLVIRKFKFIVANFLCFFSPSFLFFWIREAKSWKVPPCLKTQDKPSQTYLQSKLGNFKH